MRMSFSHENLMRISRDSYELSVLMRKMRSLSSYRLSETKEIRTLVHYPLATLKKIFSLLLPSYHEKFFFVLGCACAQQVIFFFFALTSCGFRSSRSWRPTSTHIMSRPTRPTSAGRSSAEV